MRVVFKAFDLKYPEFIGLFDHVLNDEKQTLKSYLQDLEQRDLHKYAAVLSALKDEFSAPVQWFSRMNTALGQETSVAGKVARLVMQDHRTNHGQALLRTAINQQLSLKINELALAYPESFDYCVKVRDLRQMKTAVDPLPPWTMKPLKEYLLMQYGDDDLVSMQEKVELIASITTLLTKGKNKPVCWRDIFKRKTIEAFPLDVEALTMTEVYRQLNQLKKKTLPDISLSHDALFRALKNHAFQRFITHPEAVIDWLYACNRAAQSSHPVIEFEKVFNRFDPTGQLTLVLHRARFDFLIGQLTNDPKNEFLFQYAPFREAFLSAAERFFCENPAATFAFLEQCYAVLIDDESSLNNLKTLLDGYSHCAGVSMHLNGVAQSAYDAKVNAVQQPDELQLISYGSRSGRRPACYVDNHSANTDEGQFNLFQGVLSEQDVLPRYRHSERVSVCIHPSKRLPFDQVRLVGGRTKSAAQPLEMEEYRQTLSC